MARTSLTINETTRLSDGLDSSAAMVAADMANGMDVVNSTQNIMIYIKNGGGGSIDVTFTTITTIDELELPDLVVTIPAGEERMVGAFSNSTYGSGTGTTLYIDFSSDTSVTIGAFKVGSPN